MIRAKAILADVRHATIPLHAALAFIVPFEANGLSTKLDLEFVVVGVVGGLLLRTSSPTAATAAATIVTTAVPVATSAVATILTAAATTIVVVAVVHEAGVVLDDGEGARFVVFVRPEGEVDDNVRVEHTNVGNRFEERGFEGESLRDPFRDLHSHFKFVSQNLAPGGADTLLGAKAPDSLPEDPLDVFPESELIQILEPSTIRVP